MGELEDSSRNWMDEIRDKQAGREYPQIELGPPSGHSLLRRKDPYSDIPKAKECFLKDSV
jgi:hypothetical protein